MIVFSMLVAAVTVPATSGHPTSFLESAKMHLISATNDLKLGNSQAALTEMSARKIDVTSFGDDENSRLRFKLEHTPILFMF